MDRKFPLDNTTCMVGAWVAGVGAAEGVGMAEVHIKGRGAVAEAAAEAMVGATGVATSGRHGHQRE